LSHHWGRKRKENQSNGLEYLETARLYVIPIESSLRIKELVRGCKLEMKSQRLLDSLA
jgi:hypothetical protein